MQILDPGHSYLLLNLDKTIWEENQHLRFVKREGSNFPGNKGKHSGTTIQEVLRALIDRVKYLNSQTQHWINPVLIELFRVCINLLELRAAERHNRKFKWSRQIESRPIDQTDGHCRYE